MSLVTLEPTTDLAVPSTPSELAAYTQWPADGIASPLTPHSQFVYGLSQQGDIYLYGPSATEPGPTVPGLCGIVTSLEVISKGETSRYGLRDYLEVRLLAPGLQSHHVLRLPCHQGQWSYRSLLGALRDLDLSATPVRLSAVRGRAATFIAVALDPEGLQRVKADAIGPDRDALEISVNRVRAGLGLPPQFV